MALNGSRNYEKEEVMLIDATEFGHHNAAIDAVWGLFNRLYVNLTEAEYLAINHNQCRLPPRRVAGIWM